MSAFIEVEHVTSYRYAQPVEFSKHRVMFCPRAAHDIRVLHASLEVLPLGPPAVGARRVLQLGGLGRAAGLGR